MSNIVYLVTFENYYGQGEDDHDLMVFTDKEKAILHANKFLENLDVIIVILDIVNGKKLGYIDLASGKEHLIDY